MENQENVKLLELEGQVIELTAYFENQAHIAICGRVSHSGDSLWIGALCLRETAVVDVEDGIVRYHASAQRNVEVQI